MQSFRDPMQKCNQLQLSSRPRRNYDNWFLCWLGRKTALNTQRLCLVDTYFKHYSLFREEYWQWKLPSLVMVYISWNVLSGMTFGGTLLWLFHTRSAVNHRAPYSDLFPSLLSHYHYLSPSPRNKLKSWNLVDLGAWDRDRNILTRLRLGHSQ